MREWFTRLFGPESVKSGSHAVETALAVKGRMIAKSVQLVLVSRSMADQKKWEEFAGEKVYID